MARRLVDYAVYKGDEFIFIGNVKERAAYLGVKKETIQFYASPTYRKRIESDDGLVVFKIDDDE